MVLAEKEWLASLVKVGLVAIENCIADVFSVQWQVTCLSGEMGTDCKTDDVVRVGERVGFVKVVDSPNETAFDVTPRAEILDVEIANREYTRCLIQLSTDLWPNLRPTIVGGAEKTERVRIHGGVLEIQVFLQDPNMTAKPCFEAAGGFDDVHVGTIETTRMEVKIRQKGFTRPQPSQPIRKQSPGIGQGWFTCGPMPGDCYQVA
jgi:hypothetical protein